MEIMFHAGRALTLASSASERLADAEATASNDLRRAQRDPQAFHSSIYNAGSEFALCHAESQIMSAVVGVLNESLTESIKGFYKLRKAYVTLDGIMEAEGRYIRSNNGGSNTSIGRDSTDSFKDNRSIGSYRAPPGGFDDTPPRTSVSSNIPLAPGTPITNQGPQIVDKKDSDLDAKAPGSVGDEDEDEFYDADEAPEKVKEEPQLPKYLGNLDISGKENGKPQPDSENPTSTDFKNHLQTPRSLPPTSNHDTLDHEPDSEVFANPIDLFIHSGANLCFGLILLLISMIPPAFNKLLFIIGFRGDRERGVRMLWQASKFHNINGAMAGLIILGYYNGLVGFCDIIPDSNATVKELESLEGYPQLRLEALLTDMRTRYPKSNLWQLEHARMLASKQRLEEAIDILHHGEKSPLKQVEAISLFEKSLNAMYSHQYKLCSESFQGCISLNNWSHALYYYISGACHVELYRQAKVASNTSESETHAKLATDLLRQVPTHCGRKRFMARQLPFDEFVFRKVSKWEARAQEWSVPFIDAVGVSPIEEMIYFWNGYKRMNHTHLTESLKALSWSEIPTHNPTWNRETLDERSILHVLRAAVLRNLNRHAEAKTLLVEQVIAHDKQLFKGHLKDDWTAPTAHYEMGVNLWKERRGDGGDQDRILVEECAEWIEKTARFDPYSLDARIGLKVRTAQNTLRRWREEQGEW